MEMSFYNLDEYKRFIVEVALNKKIFIFPAGRIGEIWGRYFNKIDLPWEGYIDSSPDKQRGVLNGKGIFSPNAIMTRDDVFFQMATGLVYGDEIRQALLNNECDFLEIKSRSIFNEMTCFVKNPEKSILRLREFKNIFEGKRCFIIGNGPSLNTSDLELLTNEYTFATNSIYNLFDITEWRPTFYLLYDITMGNILLKDNLFEKIASDVKYTFCNIQHLFFDMYADEEKYSNVYYLFSRYGADDTIDLPEDITKGIEEKGHSVNMMFQIAAYMGFREIYLLGVDFSFSREKMANGEIVENSDKETHPAHFKIHDYVAPVDSLYQYYVAAREFADSHGIKIYNATRGGKLEVFERVDFDSLF